jgi:2-iminobutanoate/2-iminopropanoate deaminase
MKKFVLSLLLTLLAASVMFGQETDKKVIFSTKAPKVVGPYSQAILTGNTLYVSGNIGIVPETGEMDTLNFETELRRVMLNLEAVLKEAGMSYENVVKATVFMTDLANYKLMNTIYAEYFKTAPPARETVQVVALPKGAHIEISCIAVK